MTDVEREIRERVAAEIESLIPLAAKADRVALRAAADIARGQAAQVLR